MLDPTITLPDESRILLNKLGIAAQAMDDDTTFEFLANQGYPIGWVLHTGLKNGTCAASNDSLLALCKGGCVECEGDLTKDECIMCSLTSQGVAYCRLMLVDVVANHEAPPVA